MKRPRRRLLLGLLLAAAGFYAVRVAFWRPFGVPAGGAGDGWARSSGVVHVHTTLSDGGGSPEEVIAAARAAGLGFVAITDHENLDGKRYEGYHDGVLVLVGTEISTTGGHLLGLGLPDPVFRFSGDPGDALDDVRHLGGVAFAAHPTSTVEAFQWTRWDLPGPWGMEVLNGDSQWRAAGLGRLLRTAALYGLNSRYALLTSLTAPTDALARWDTLLRERPVPALAGADAHSRVVLRKQTALRFPSYEALFAQARNHVLLERPLSGRADEDGRAVVSALARGRSWVALDALAPGDGFSLVVEGPSGRWTLGDTVPAQPGLRLRAGGALPEGARLTLLRDGQAVATQAGRLQSDGLAAGVYRVEVHLPGWDVPWLLSNPVYVFDEAGARRREDRAAWPVPQPPPAAAEVLDAFEAATKFTPGHDPASTLADPLLDTQAGEDGRGAARLRFRLAPVSPTNPNPFCALVDWTARDLRGRQGLVFSIKGDGVYRMWVQVRDANPASADEGTEWWFASVRTSPEWTRVSVPFAKLRSINKKTDGRLDLDKVKALVFVLDRAAVKPGTEGTIWVDDLGVY